MTGTAFHKRSAKVTSYFRFTLLIKVILNTADKESVLFSDLVGARIQILLGFYF